MKTSLSASVISFFCATIGIAQQDRVPAYLPQSVEQAQFALLLEKSPFTRYVTFSDTIVLTGVGELNGGPVATLIDTENVRSFSITEEPNPEGWMIRSLSTTSDLEAAVAEVAIPDLGVIKVRYDEDRIKAASQRMKYKAQANRQKMAAKMREIQARGGNGGGPAHDVPKERVEMFRKIEQTELPKGYNPGAGRNAEESHKLHQSYVDKRMAGMSAEQRGMVGQLWKQKTVVDPNMKNRGASFVRILEHVANHGRK